MIFPVLRGILSPLQAPITFCFLLINLMVFFFTYEQFERADAKLEAILDDHSFLEKQGSAFSVMIRREPAQFSGMLQELSTKSLKGEKTSREMLGNLALRNSVFMSKAERYDFGGDEVANELWKKKFEQIGELKDEHPSYLWGISDSHHQWMQWISYQFAHSGWAHLFWNMVFLLIFGSFVEAQLGGSFVVVCYLGGGLLGAAAYSMLSGISSSPLVGASAAVSALMGLVAFRWWKNTSIRFVYWLLPIRGYYGFVLLPGWVLIAVSLLPDVSGYLSATPEFGSVAHSAHLGGTLWGAVIAMAVGSGWMVGEKPARRPKDSVPSNS